MCIRDSDGIDCERCHGPGEIHVQQKLSGNIIDTSKYIDYSIVNPKKLNIDLQFDVCQRCHLQGNAVLLEGKTFNDFKPGEHLKDVMDIYLPRYEDDDDFIMASHPDRLKQSACFQNSTLTCISCHNPHKSVTSLSSDYFDSNFNYGLSLNKLNQNFNPTDGYKFIFSQELPWLQVNLLKVNFLFKH